MLSRDDNEMLVRVGPGTGMGEFFRLFWIPFLLSKDLVADGRPKRVRLLGEDLVAFRASDNTIGLLDSVPSMSTPLMLSSSSLPILNDPASLLRSDTLLSSGFGLRDVSSSSSGFDFSFDPIDN